MAVLADEGALSVPFEDSFEAMILIYLMCTIAVPSSSQISNPVRPFSRVSPSEDVDLFMSLEFILQSSD